MFTSDTSKWFSWKFLCPVLASGYTAGLKIIWEVSLLFSSLEEMAGVFSSFTTAKDRKDSLVHFGPYLAPYTEQFRGDGRRSCWKAPRRPDERSTGKHSTTAGGAGRLLGELAWDLQLARRVENLLNSTPTWSGVLWTDIRLTPLFSYFTVLLDNSVFILPFLSSANRCTSWGGGADPIPEKCPFSDHAEWMSFVCLHPALSGNFQEVRGDLQGAFMSKWKSFFLQTCCSLLKIINALF